MFMAANWFFVSHELHVYTRIFPVRQFQLQIIYIPQKKRILNFLR